MQTITQKTVTHAAPEKIWEFLTSLDKDDNDKRWHPKDHIVYRRVRGDLSCVGSVAYFEEHIGDFTLKLNYRLVKAEYPSYLEYAPTYPLALLKAGKATFRIVPIDESNTELTAYVEYGYSAPLVGAVVDWVIGLFVRKADAERHIHEEGENIKRILGST